jgi:hypothetical protein
MTKNIAHEPRLGGQPQTGVLWGLILDFLDISGSMPEHPRGTPPYCSTQHESKGRAGYGQRVRFLVESSDFYKAAAGSRLRRDLPAIPFGAGKIGQNGNLRDALAITLRSEV